MADRPSGPPERVSVSEAKEAVDEIERTLAAEVATLAKAEGEVRGLELRVADGDATVAALDLVNARHAAETSRRRLDKLTARKQEAAEALRQAQAHETVDGWEALAPSLRGEIRAAAVRLVEARDEIERLVALYNGAAGDVQRSLAGMTDPGGRYAMPTFGHRFAGSESLRPLFAAGVVAASLTRERAEVPPEFPRDVLPWAPAAPGTLSQRDEPRNAPGRPSALTDQQTEEALRSPRSGVRRSPFGRHNEEA